MLATVESRTLQVQQLATTQKPHVRIRVLIDDNDRPIVRKASIALRFGSQVPQATLTVGRDRGYQPSPQFASWFAKLRTFANLSDGWDSYKAPKPSPLAIINAARYLMQLDILAWEPHRVEPSVMGGVGITHRRGARKVYVEFYNAGRIHALFSDRTTKTMDTMPVEVGLSAGYHFIRKAQEYLNG